MIFKFDELSPFDKQYYLQHLIGPRPICFASTINAKGQINLSPFSFFNMFSANPPILVFSPSRRVRDNTTKHTLQNVLEVPEVAINIVTYDIVQQVSLSSCEYPEGVNEFLKAGLTMEPSSLIKPPLVKESVGKFECKVLEIKSLGDTPGAGNLVICEVLIMHVDDNILDTEKKLDQRNIHHAARLGGNWYCKVDKASLFEVEKPNVKLGIGFDGLPQHIRNSKVLTGNQLGILANTETVPDWDDPFNDSRFIEISNNLTALHQYAAELINAGEVNKAWQVLLRSE